MDNIVFLDRETLDYGDLDFSSLKKRGNYNSYPLSSEKQILSRLKNCDIAITNKCVFNKSLLQSLPQLKAIAVAATGVNNIDLLVAKRQGIQVMNVSNYSTDSVAEHTFAVILALSKNLVGYNHAAHQTKWADSPHFTLGHLPNRELAGKTLGILGYGAIGQRVALIAKAFKLNVLVGNIPGRKTTNKSPLKRVSFDQLLKQSDILTIHTPLTPLTKNIFTSSVLKKMKRGSCLINMARGGIVNEVGLAKALKSGHLAGAALDVLNQEPPPKAHPLYKIPNLILTPHIAWGSQEARQRLVQEIALNIQAFQNGKKRNCLIKW